METSGFGFIWQKVSNNDLKIELKSWKILSPVFAEDDLK